MRRKSRYKKIAQLIGMYGALFIFLASTNPRQLHPLLLIAPVLWLFLTLFITFKTILRVTRAGPSDGKSDPSIAARSLVLSGSVSVLLLLQSINQLTLKDILLLLFFGFLALLYVRRFKLVQKRE